MIARVEAAEEEGTNEVAAISLHKPRSRLARLDVAPFVVLYLAWAVAVVRLAAGADAPPAAEPDTCAADGLGAGAAAKLALAGLAAAHALLYLATVWSVDLRCAVRFRRAASLADAALVAVTPAAFSGGKEVVPLERRPAAGAGAARARQQHEGEEEEVSFSFRKLTFVWDAAAAAFRELEYPSRLTFAEYRAAGGLAPGAAAAAAARWGANRFEMPAPRFLELLKDQLTAPFFCFQVFCVALWALDEFWYYSVFTLFMLVSFECTVVAQRRRNLDDVRALRRPPAPLWVRRGGRWEWLPGEQLVPGDLVSLARGGGGGGRGGGGRAGRDGRPRAAAAAPAAGSAAPPAAADAAPPGAGSHDVVVQADVLLLAGTAIVDEAVLTGESTPQWKAPVGDDAAADAADASEAPDAARLSLRAHRGHVAFGGTRLLKADGDAAARLRAPDGGCLGVVLRTGFGTAQGRLMRAILHSTERVTANNAESFAFIGFLLVFALAAAAHVLRAGLADPGRDRFKLVLNCIMILTSVVPPELPMELTIAVNASLVALARARVFCTEPFRIPLAGKVTACCFDKTGTLTSDRMALAGVDVAAAAGGGGGGGAGAAAAGLTPEGLVADAAALPPEVARVLAGCQALVRVDAGAPLVGDPVERAAVEAVGWDVRGDRAAAPAGAPGGREVLSISHRFHFSSALKRMSVVARGEGGASGAAGAWWVLAKGAPEALGPLLAAAPPGYAAAYRRHAARGGRVLALAYRRLPGDLTPSGVRALGRGAAEAGLTFAGFAVFTSPLKPESAPALGMLRASGHQLAMITGDAALTACHVARECGIVAAPPERTLILGPARRPAMPPAPPAAAAAAAGLEWASADGSVRAPFDGGRAAALALAAANDLCVPGDALAALCALPYAGAGAAPASTAADLYVPLTAVFARVTPEQKELVVKTLRAAGLGVLMCGDGTNDVGALKGAHVGVALLPPPEAPAPRPGAPPPPPPGPGAKMLAELRAKNRQVPAFMERLAASMDAQAARAAAGGGGAGGGPLDALDGDAPPLVRPGDASMASPFTAKAPHVGPVLDVLRQGRTTLVTTVQMFKILGLLCLSTAYSLSVLYLDGIKLGDLQATAAGLLTAGMFLFISNARPLATLARERPHPDIFSRYVFASMLGQFAVHLALLSHLQAAAHAAMAPADRQAPDAEFKPNLVNTVCFLANFGIQTLTFAVNYVGRPFNTPLAENRLFATSVRWSVAMYAALVLDVPPGLSAWFSLVRVPGALRAQMLGLGAAAWAACAAVERGARAAFPAAQPPAKGGVVGPSAGFHYGLALPPAGGEKNKAL